MRRLALALVVALVGCKGPEGPMGPVGPAGPAGPAGVPHVFTAAINSSGAASVTLPSAAGTDAAKPPSMTCYMALTPSSGTWLSVADSYSSTSAYCGSVFTGGVWHPTMNDGPAGWTAAFVVVY